MSTKTLIHPTRHWVLSQRYRPISPHLSLSSVVVVVVEVDVGVDGVGGVGLPGDAAKESQEDRRQENPADRPAAFHATSVPLWHQHSPGSVSVSPGSKLTMFAEIALHNGSSFTFCAHSVRVKVPSATSSSVLALFRIYSPGSRHAQHD